MDSDAIDQADAMLISAEVHLRKIREALNRHATRHEREHWFRELAGVISKCEIIKLWLKV